jgi:hypothetical protein
MHAQHHQLLEEVSRLKQQLRSGAVPGASLDLGGRGEDPAEVAQLKQDLKKCVVVAPSLPLFHPARHTRTHTHTHTHTLSHRTPHRQPHSLFRYIDFYDKVLAALGHRSPNIPMSKIITEIKTLKQART